MQLLETIKNLPSSAGVYQYFDKNGRLLYIGKAKNLAKRVKSYWKFTPKLQPDTKVSQRIRRMLEQTTSLNYIIVNSEHDALILENSLIKQLNPKYNILLRDDKTYPYIYLDTSKEYPRFEITRKIIPKKGIRYFGPYSIGAKEILNSLYDLCKLVQKRGSLKSKKKCLYHQIDRCLAPCELPIAHEIYQKEVQRAIHFIEDKKLLIDALKNKMLFYADALRFEEAQELRDTIERIERSQIKSEIDFATDENYDIFVIEVSQNEAIILRLFMRHGKIISSTHNRLSISENFSLDETYSQTLIDFYKETRPPIVAPILVADSFEDTPLLEEYLTKIFEKKASIKVPKRGKKRELIALARRNAKELLSQKRNSPTKKILQEIQELCHLQKLPQRIEIFDNSHISGVATVGAMVVYEDGKFEKKAYRTYHLHAHDEYGQMREILSRRVENFTKNPPPDLWILDGGATLLQLAIEILHSNALFFDVIAIAKEKIDAKAHRAKGKANDTLYTKEEKFSLQNSDKRLQFVQNLRDEAHRCAINFHRKRKLKLDKESKLLNLNGISQAKVQKLLYHFGTFEALRKLSEAEICLILNAKDAKTIKNIYN